MLKKIIIADDDPGIRENLKLILGKLGYELTLHANADLLMANDFEMPDLFILDRQLNGVDGLELCKYLKQNNSTSQVPVIMMSGMSQIVDMAKAAGANGALEKPFTIEQLEDIVSRNLADKKS